MKAKGSRFERKLIEELWKVGFAAVRVAGSGVSSHPCPDIVAGNGKKFLAIEVKMRKELPLYLDAMEVDKLLKFSSNFGAESYIALKLPRKKWRFFKVENLQKTEKGYRIDEETYLAGFDIKELLGVKQKKLDSY